MNNEDKGNIILHQISEELSIQEVKPVLSNLAFKNALTLNNGIIEWSPYYDVQGINGINICVSSGLIFIDASIDTRVIIGDRFKETNIYYLNERLGVGRPPLHSYKFDIAVSENTLTTAFHIGDGTFGFSMGNGTANGFIPEIIGMGSDENDAGLYMIGRAGNSLPSTVPLIIIDGRNNLHQEVKNRPIFGITNANYNEYKLLVDQNGLVGIGKIPKIYNLEIRGKVQAADFILDSSISFSEIIEIIIEQKEEIDKLNHRITELEKIIKKWIK